MGAVQQGALGAAAALYNKVGSVRDSAQARAKALTPEEKALWTERGVAGLTLAASVGQIVGGKKVKAASVVTSAAVSCLGPSAAAARSAEVAPEMQLVEVVATQEAGQPMLVIVDGAEYTVVVPAGVAKGQPFRFEVPLPPVPRAVAVAAPAASTGASSAGGSAPVSGMGLHSAISDARAVASAARTTQQVAKDLGITPQQAVSVGRQGVKLAGALGITPQTALKAATAGATASATAPQRR